MQRLEIIRGGSADPTGRRGAALVAAADRGALVRLAPGRFVDAERWRAADARVRHLARIDAVDELIAPRLVLSHESALALHGLPWSGEFPDVVHVIDPRRETSQALRLLRKHPGKHRPTRLARAPSGRLVTDLRSTVVDIALTQELRRSVPVLDVALRRGVDRTQLGSELEAKSAAHGRDRARFAIEFADPRSGSVGESIARVALDEVGAPRPELQAEFHDADGFAARVDFWFPDHGVVLEFDGAAKYRDPAMRAAGLTAADVLLQEKRREDRLRRVPDVRQVGRFGWPETQDTARFRALLLGLGLPLEPRRFRRIR
ncbi:hypothetical protein [Curtobacterium herbarum]|uniref:Transcriptional regulator, AbiEi antitoxin, Type IV TA system n=1 Tax=Curtobacterium herbarum TaxID=150122 RepID=A0ABN1ZGX7_9MICO|nr:hypothetical protein [Curtobacterium herbarum]MBM7474968.1 hypothetical protein [Curtobacterium herbarum]MCS6545611.1 hypothetical protein [Curtobacterium herbarum]